MSNNYPEVVLMGFVQADNRGRILLTKFRPGSAGVNFRVSLREDGALVVEAQE